MLHPPPPHLLLCVCVCVLHTRVHIHHHLRCEAGSPAEPGTSHFCLVGWLDGGGLSLILSTVLMCAVSLGAEELNSVSRMQHVLYY